MPFKPISNIRCKYCHIKFDSAIDAYKHICINSLKKNLWKNSSGRNTVNKIKSKFNLPSWLDEENLKAIKKDKELRLNRARKPRKSPTR